MVFRGASALGCASPLEGGCGRGGGGWGGKAFRSLPPIATAVVYTNQNDRPACIHRRMAISSIPARRPDLRYEFGKYPWLRSSADYSRGSLLDREGEAKNMLRWQLSALVWRDVADAGRGRCSIAAWPVREAHISVLDR